MSDVYGTTRGQLLDMVNMTVGFLPKRRMSCAKWDKFCNFLDLPRVVYSHCTPECLSKSAETPDERVLEIAVY